MTLQSNKYVYALIINNDLVLSTSKKKSGIQMK